MGIKSRTEILGAFNLVKQVEVMTRTFLYARDSKSYKRAVSLLEVATRGELVELITYAYLRGGHFEDMNAVERRIRELADLATVIVGDSPQVELTSFVLSSANLYLEPVPVGDVTTLELVRREDLEEFLASAGVGTY